MRQHPGDFRHRRRWRTPDAARRVRLSDGRNTRVEASGGRLEPRYVIIALTRTMTLDTIAINPNGACRDAPSAAVGDHLIETTTTHGLTDWKVAASGRFGKGNRDKLNYLPLAAGSTARVTHVRCTMLSTQAADEGVTCPGDHSGCAFVGTKELRIYGTPG